MKKITRLLAMGICVLLVTLLLRGYTAAFTAAHFPDTQPGTYWTDEDGILTVRVSDEPVQSSRAVKRYACQVSVCWNGERYAASFGQNPRATLALTLEDGSGTAVRDFEWNAYMPNCHTLRLEPADSWQEDAARLLSGKTELTLHRIEE